MKKSRFTLAICMIAMAVTISATVVSCKKDGENTLNQKAYNTPQAFDYRQIDDKLTYITDFKKRMTESKDNESFYLDDAAWHLACLANLDFCNINVKYDDFQLDTICMQVEVLDGTMLLNDIGTTYEQMCAKIQQFKKGFNHCDQNLYYINVSIDADGSAKIALMTSFTSSTKFLTWYFSDPFEAAEVCDTYFSDDSVYYWNGLAASELERVLNIFEHHENGSGINGALCYFPTRNHLFDYNNTNDPNGSGYYYINESRVFAKRYADPHPDYIFELLEMCYGLDSNLGLGYDYINDNLYPNEHPVCWTIKCKTGYINLLNYIYHQLFVEYGQLIFIPDPNSK